MAIQDAAKVGLQSEPNIFSFRCMCMIAFQPTSCRRHGLFHGITSVAGSKKIIAARLFPFGNLVTFHDRGGCGSECCGM